MMTKRPINACVQARPAATAIAAVLALSSTMPLAAQEVPTGSPLAMPAQTAAPQDLMPLQTQTAPEATVPPAPQTTNVSQPMVQQVPKTIVVPDIDVPRVEPEPEPEPAASVASATTRPAPVRDSASSTTVSAADPAVLPAAMKPAIIPVMSDPAASAPVGQTRVTQETTTTNADWMYIAGAGAAGLALVVLLLGVGARRRRGNRAIRQQATAGRREAAVRIDPVEPAPAEPKPLHRNLDGDGNVTTRGAAARQPIAAAPSAAATRSVSFGAGPEHIVTPHLPRDPMVNRSVPVSASAAQADTAEGRHELIDRMVAAEPDRAIPFHSLKARRRRARLIVQTLVQRMKDNPNLDFGRFYRNFGSRYGEQTAAFA
ncbi:hypothetical protein [Croceicoccus sp. Ery15]|uniref:hypothetical protein n=1 Tax=Croceicoccus sp. Ery15 TaxID=1703338 RepID=UPI001E4BC7E4|nr:hypothetical protein [Croceicoccus sp. Ery15]